MWSPRPAPARPISRLSLPRWKTCCSSKGRRIIWAGSGISPPCSTSFPPNPPRPCFPVVLAILTLGVVFSGAQFSQHRAGAAVRLHPRAPDHRLHGPLRSQAEHDSPGAAPLHHDPGDCPRHPPGEQRAGRRTSGRPQPLCRGGAAEPALPG